jgi:hypothetical protein
MRTTIVEHELPDAVECEEEEVATPEEYVSTLSMPTTSPGTFNH